jgi:hypothetical protein
MDEGEYYLSVRGSSIPESVLSQLAAAVEPEAEATGATEETSSLQLAVDGEEPAAADGPVVLQQSVVDWLPDVFEEYDGLDEVAEEVSALIDWDADVVG